jgi:hypothetical protein
MQRLLIRFTDRMMRWDIFATFYFVACEKSVRFAEKIFIMKGRLRKHSTNRCHAYIYYVAIGSTRELAPSEVLSADSTDYLLGGSLTLRNGRLDKYQFEGGYCQAEQYAYNADEDNITFHYYDRDHLGNVRQVTTAPGSSNGTVVQRMDYYPFGAQLCGGTYDSNLQSRSILPSQTMSAWASAAKAVHPADVPLSAI